MTPTAGSGLFVITTQRRRSANCSISYCTSLFLSFSPSSFSSRILSLGGTVILHLPVLIRCTVTGWTALTSAGGLKHTCSAEPGSYLAASLHTTHTHTHTHPCTHWYKKQPGIQTQSSVRRKRREKEQQKKSKQTENCKLNVTAVESLTGSGRLANWRCRTASMAARSSIRRMMGLNWRAWPAYLKTWCWAATSAGSSRRSGPGKGPPFWHVGADWQSVCLLSLSAMKLEIGAKLRNRFARVVRRLTS